VSSSPTVSACTRPPKPFEQIYRRDLFQHLMGADQDSTDDAFEAPEGRLLSRGHRFRERNRRLVERKKAQLLRETGRVACEACHFDFALR
jgi:predicted HNH restriction endonuclease